VQFSRPCMLDSLCAVQSSLYVRLAVCSSVVPVSQAQISAPHTSLASKQATERCNFHVL